MKGRFVIRTGKDLIEYTDTDMIPMSFDNLIEFAPEFPEGPHTEEEHEEMETYNNVLKELMTRERM